MKKKIIKKKTTDKKKDNDKNKNNKNKFKLNIIIIHHHYAFSFALNTNTLSEAFKKIINLMSFVKTLINSKIIINKTIIPFSF